MSERESQQSSSPAVDAGRVLVLLCTYNEVENLPQLLAQLMTTLPQADFLVVDDNSPDGTGDWVKEQPAFRPIDRLTSNDVVSHSNRGGAVYLLQRSGKHGLGTATRAGLEWCLARNYDFVIQLDADLSHPPAFAPQLLAACQSLHLPCDVAIGSRYVPGGGLQGLSPHRRWISRALNAYATTVLRLPIKDCSGSYRCYRIAALRRIDLSRLSCPGYGFLEEILVNLYRNGARLVEIPIQFEARLGGHSKLGIGDALGALQVIHRLAWRR